MKKNFGFTALAVLTLALGIGSTSAIFSLVEGVVLDPLPYPRADRLVQVLQSYPEKGLDTWRLSQANFAVYREGSASFEGLAAYSVTGINLTGVDRAQRLLAARVTAGFFDILGVEPVRGRTFRPEEDRPFREDSEPASVVCIVAHGFWQRQLGGDPEVLGRKLTLNDTPVTIVGVAPPGFSFPTPEVQVWVPLGLDPEARFPWFLTAVGRLESGVTPAMAQAETTGLLWSAGRQDPQMVSRNDPPPEGAGLKTLVVPLKEAVVGATDKPLMLLQFAVIFILLIACANIANFLLSRAFGRRREIAVRHALGASRGRIVRQLLTESVVLALLGGLLGLLLAAWGLRFLGRLPVEGIPRIHEVGLDGTVLLVTLLLSLVTGLLLGVIPAFRTFRLGLHDGMNEGHRGSAGASGRRMNRVLVVAQLALSLILLIGAGLMLKSFRNLLDVDPGFRAEGLVTMVVPPSAQKYPTPEQVLEFQRSLVEEVGRPGDVEAVGLTTSLPFSGYSESDGYLVEGQEPPEGGDAPQVQLQAVSAGYFDAMGIRLLRGRPFRSSDRLDSPWVAIVDETLADRHWPEGGALGQRIRTTGDPEWLTIVGVVSAIRTGDLTRASEPHMYFFLGQGPWLRTHLVVRTTADPERTALAVEETVRRLDPDVPVYDVGTMEEVVGRTLNRQKLTNLLLTAFAVLSLLLGSLGIYGVMSVFVASRTREMGIRLALGEEPAGLKRSVLREGAILAGMGIAAGVVGALLLTRAMAGLLFEVNAQDPWVFTLLPVLLMAVAMATCYLPAHRAARVDPLEALRDG